MGMNSWSCCSRVSARSAVTWLRIRGARFSERNFAARYPELFYAYVGIGQAADLGQTSQVLYQFALDSARGDGNKQAIEELERIDQPPHSFTDHRYMERWVAYYSEREHPSLSRTRMTRLAFESPAYSWLDLLKIPLGVRYSFQRLWKEIFYETSLFKEAPRIDVPVYFFLGRHDKVVTSEVAQRYFEALDAPRGKQIVWFEQSGHWPHFEEPVKYQEQLLAILRQPESATQ